MLSSELPYIDDPGGSRVPGTIHRVIDAHVHVFPDKIFAAVHGWFDAFAWKIRYKMNSKDLIAYLLNRGVSHVVALQYAHKPGIAQGLNQYMAGLCERFPGRVTGMATVFPGEPGADEILGNAFDTGLSGVKLHAHVQCFDMAGPEMHPICAVCADRDMPMVIHAGQEPASDHYACDPYEICRADKVEAVLNAWPNLRICVPHLGFGEVDAYQKLIAAYDTLWLDTAMVLADYFPDLCGFPLSRCRLPLAGYRADRIMYGSDFPNIPYNWDRELLWLEQHSGLSPEGLDRLLYRNAEAFFRIQGR